MSHWAATPEAVTTALTTPWWSFLLPFIGGLIPAGVAAGVALRGQNKSSRQSGRSEWRQRFDRAVDLVTHEQAAHRSVGEELLADLIESDLGSPADRLLARRVAETVVRAAAAEQADAVIAQAVVMPQHTGIRRMFEALRRRS